MLERFATFTTRDKVAFTKRLAFLMQAGIGIHESLTIIKNQTKATFKKQIFESVIDDVAAGRSLSKSLARYKKIFGTFTIQIIEIGESSGSLPENLTYLAEELKKKQQLEQKVRSALVYPIFITIATLGVTSMLITFIFPKILPIFITLNISLPPTTKALLVTSAFIHHFWLEIIISTSLCIGVFIISKRTFPIIQKIVDISITHLPIVGTIARSYNCANFCRTLGLTLKSGIPLSESLYIIAETTNNILYQEAYRDFATHVLMGEKISLSLSRYPHLFPDMLTHMIYVGETSGSLVKSLHHLAELYSAEVDESTKNLSSSIEPILLLCMGILVGIIAISIISPIYEVTKYIGNTR